MSWNYRVIKYNNNLGFGLHEVYYNALGNPDGYIAKPITTSDALFLSDAVEDMQKDLDFMIAGLQKEVLTVSDLENDETDTD